MSDPEQTFDPNPATNPDVQEALSVRYSNATILLVPLQSGKVAVFGRDSMLHCILDSAPSFEDLTAISKALQRKLMTSQIYDSESRFLGEPTTQSMARDIRRQHNPPRQRVSRPSVEGLDL